VDKRRLIRRAGQLSAAAATPGRSRATEASRRKTLVTVEFGMPNC
jgi:hypothetical protein